MSGIWIDNCRHKNCRLVRYRLGLKQNAFFKQFFLLSRQLNKEILKLLLVNVRVKLKNYALNRRDLPFTSYISAVKSHYC